MSDSRKRSQIWTHFNFLDNTKAECRVCKKKISYRSGSTNNLHRHMRTVRPSVQWEEKAQPIEPAINEGASVSTATVAAAAAAVSTASCITPPQPPKPPTPITYNFLQKSVTPARQNTIDEELAKVIALDFQPFSVVDDKGFRRFTHALNPMYAIPSRKTLPKNHPLYDRERASLQERVKKATAVCLTTDSWTSHTTTFFL